MDRYPLFTLYVTDEGKAHVEMDSVFEDMECVEESSKIIKSYNEMLIGIADSLTDILIKAQKEEK